jgi:cysteine desulfurase
VIVVCKFLEKQGFETTYLPVDESGRVKVTNVGQAIRPETILITIMHANNETGSIQPIAEISELAAANNILFHTDAAQSVGKIPTDVNQLNVSLMSIAGHKLYAPKGVGALYVRQPLQLEPFCHGAGQESGLRAGTENVIGITALGAACEIAGRNLENNMAQMKYLRDRLHEGIIRQVNNVRLNGHREFRLPNTLYLSFHGLEANRILEEIGLEVAASAGAACHSDMVKISHVLTAMNVPEDWAKGTIRFSVGRMTTKEQIDRAVDAVVEAIRQLKKQ